MRERCPNATRYLAKKPPTCGCLTCRLKWLEAEVERLRVETRRIDKAVVNIDDTASPWSWL